MIGMVVLIKCRYAIDSDKLITPSSIAYMSRMSPYYVSEKVIPYLVENNIITCEKVGRILKISKSSNWSDFVLLCDQYEKVFGKIKREKKVIHWKKSW